MVEKLQRQGYEAYVVGGCLRDLLLGKHQKILMWQQTLVQTNSSGIQTSVPFSRSSFPPCILCLVAM